MNEIRWTCKPCRAITPQYVIESVPAPDQPGYRKVHLQCGICRAHQIVLLMDTSNIVAPEPEPREEEPAKKKRR